MKTGKKLALTLGLVAGAALTVVATKSTKRVRQHVSKKVSPERVNAFDDSEVYYI